MKFSNVAILSLLHLSIVFGNKLPGAMGRAGRAGRGGRGQACNRERNQSGMQKTADEQQT